MKKHFKVQLNEGAKNVFYYGIEAPIPGWDFENIEVRRHDGTLDTFPNLEYVRHLSDEIPLFREKCKENE